MIVCTWYEVVGGQRSIIVLDKLRLIYRTIRHVAASSWHLGDDRDDAMKCGAEWGTNPNQLLMLWTGCSDV
jgi:hypothetical protein